MNCELPQIVRTVQKRALVGNIEFLAGEAPRQRRLSCLYQDALMAVKVDIVVEHPGRALRLVQKEVDVGLDNGGESVRNTTGSGKVPDKRGGFFPPGVPGETGKGGDMQERWDLRRIFPSRRFLMARFLFSHKFQRQEHTKSAEHTAFE